MLFAGNAKAKNWKWSKSFINTPLLLLPRLRCESFPSGISSSHHHWIGFTGRIYYCLPRSADWSDSTGSTCWSVVRYARFFFNFRPVVKRQKQSTALKVLQFYSEPSNSYTQSINHVQSAVCCRPVRYSVVAKPEQYILFCLHVLGT